MLPATAQLAIDVATRQAILLLVVYLLISLGGMLSFAYGARFARIGLAASVAAAVILLQSTAVHVPFLLPVAVVGLTFVALAGLSVRRERAGRADESD
jgi:hypothetical protein